MNTRIRELLEQMQRLESELRDALHERETKLHYHLVGKRIEFDRAVREAHKKLKVGWVRWLSRSKPLNVITAPVIYSLIVPLLFLDLSVSIYQAICFRAYGIPRVKRNQYIVIDRHHLAYLNPIQKIACAYCGYANGLMAYCREIASRTEQYWCPIKHAHKILDTHHRYAKFLDYAEAEDFARKTKEFRKELANEENQ